LFSARASAVKRDQSSPGKSQTQKVRQKRDRTIGELLLQVRLLLSDVLIDAVIFYAYIFDKL